MSGGLPIVGLVFVIIMVDGFDLQFIGFVAPEIARSWSVPLAAFSPVFAATLAGTIPGAALAGFVARRLGLRATLAMCLAIFGLATLGALWAGDIATLAGVRFIA